MDNLDKIAFVRRYFDHLTASEMDAIIAMFEPNAQVLSPYAGYVQAGEFFSKLGVASARNKLTVFDVLVSENSDAVAAYFEYDWTLGSGDNIIFQGVDYFKFSATGKFASMSIFYDTYPSRQIVGDKYGG